MKPRRILYVAHVVGGGIAVVINQMVRGLDRSRYDPIVLFDTNVQSNIREKLSNSGIKTIDLMKHVEKQVTRMPSILENRNVGTRIEDCLGTTAGQLFFSLKSFHKFLLQQAPKIKLFVKAIRENRIDLVHTHRDLRGGKPEMFAAKYARVPCVFHRHAYSTYSYFDKFFARFIDAFIYISNDVANHYFGQGEPGSKGIVIHNGTDVKELTQYDVAQIKRDEFKCNTKDPLVGIIGRIEWWKGQEFFIEAIAEVAKKVPNVKGVIIGGERIKKTANRIRYFNQLQSLVKSLDIEEKIIFTGFRSDVPRLLAALDVVVHASCQPEPFGLVVIEGMAAGKPVVATAAGGVLDIIEDGVNGLLVPPGDSNAMAKAILQILCDRDKAEQIGLAARRRVIEKFTIQHQVTAVQKLYDSILGIA